MNDWLPGWRNKKSKQGISEMDNRLAKRRTEWLGAKWSGQERWRRWHAICPAIKSMGRGFVFQHGSINRHKVQYLTPFRVPMRFQYPLFSRRWGRWWWIIEWIGGTQKNIFKIRFKENYNYSFLDSIIIYIQHYQVPSRIYLLDISVLVLIKSLEFIIVSLHMELFKYFVGLKKGLYLLFYS